jgi:hypothetical protein
VRVEVTTYGSSEADWYGTVCVLCFLTALWSLFIVLKHGHISCRKKKGHELQVLEKMSRSENLK